MYIKFFSKRSNFFKYMYFKHYTKCGIKFHLRMLQIFWEISLGKGAAPPGWQSKTFSPPPSIHPAKTQLPTPMQPRTSTPIGYALFHTFSLFQRSTYQHRQAWSSQFENKKETTLSTPAVLDIMRTKHLDIRWPQNWSCIQSPGKHITCFDAYLLPLLLINITRKNIDCCPL